MNKTLHQAKRITGEVLPPSSLREALEIAALSLFCEGDTLLENPPKCRGSEELFAFFRQNFDNAAREGAQYTFRGQGGFSGEAPAVLDVGDNAELLETLAPLFFRRGGLFTGNLFALTRRFRQALGRLDRAGFNFSLSEGEGRFSLALSPGSPDSVEITLERGDNAVKTACLFALLSASTGENRLIEAVPMPDSIETLLQTMGASISAHKKGESVVDDDAAAAEPDNSELARRIRRIQTKKEAAAGDKPIRTVTLTGGARLKGGCHALLGDPALAAPFLLAGTLLNNSSVTVKGISGSATSGLFAALRRMGAPLRTERGKAENTFACTAETIRLAGRRISGELTAAVGEQFPFLAVAAAYADGQTVIRDADFLRDGPVDLLEATISNLKTMGAKVGEIEDGIVIEGAREYDGAEFNVTGHPALGLAFAVAAAKNKGESVLTGAESLDRVWPDFFTKFESLLETGK
ncbi:MAG: hypothetical protein V1913_17750 [Fibrobacterota bacterium]